MPLCLNKVATGVPEGRCAPIINPMSHPQERIETDVKAAMKSGDKERLGTLRMLLAEIKNERIRQGDELDEDAFVPLVRKGIKQRHEAAEKYRAGGREETAAKEEREAAILEEYLPQQMSEDEVRAEVESYAAEHDLSGMGDMGRLMGAMMGKLGTRADGGTVNKVARDVLTSRAES